MSTDLTARQIIKEPIISEKMSRLMELNNVYGFVVDKRANKIQIKSAVESLWDVEVVKVNTIIRKGKPRRVRWSWSHEKDVKRALVKLAEGQTIE